MCGWRGSTLRSRSGFTLFADRFGDNGRFGRGGGVGGGFLRGGRWFFFFGFGFFFGSGVGILGFERARPVDGNIAFVATVDTFHEFGAGFIEAGADIAAEGDCREDEFGRAIGQDDREGDSFAGAAESAADETDAGGGDVAGEYFEDEMSAVGEDQRLSWRCGC